MGKKLIITEKPSVAEDISKVLGIKSKEDGYRENDEYVITWAIGHLLELQDPEDIDKKYKAWMLKELPILPQKFKWKVVSRTRDQYRVIKKLLKRKDLDGVINACDAGREGELIFREIIENEKVKLPIERLWLSSMTERSIREGFDNLLPGEELLGLANAARSRSESDWLIGINCTRAVTKRLQSRYQRQVFSVGRVQTPTLGMLVDRELEIISFVPEPYSKIEASFEAKDHQYKGTLVLEKSKRDNPDRIFDKEQLQAIQKILDQKPNPALASETRKTSSRKPYPFFDLTSLQREANQKFGISAQRTLQAAQRLYEQHKVLTYPRTDSRYLPEDYSDYLKNSIDSLGQISEYSKYSKFALGKYNPGDRRIFDDKKVSDHFAIIPTGQIPKKELEGDDRRIFDLVVRRVLSIFYPAAVYENVERTTTVKELSFRSKGKYLKEPGWLEVYGRQEEQGQALPPLGSDGCEAKFIDYESTDHMTRPPNRIGEAKLLSLMEFAGKDLSEEELQEAMEGKGIGTPATRADIIENLIKKGYVQRVGSSLKATAKAIRLIDVIQRIDIQRLNSVKLTAEMEAKLKSVEASQLTREEFMDGIVAYVQEVVDQLRDFQYEDLYKNEEPVLSERLGKSFHEYMYGYTTGEEENPVVIRKEYHGRYIDKNTLKQLLEKGETSEIEMVFWDGKPLKGKLVLNDRFEVEAYSKNEDGSFQPMRSKSTAELASEETVLSEVEIQSEYLGQTGKFKRTSDAYYFEIPSFPDVLGKAPKAFQSGPFIGRLPVEVCKRPISEDEAKSFFSAGKTELLYNFVSKKGRNFNAKLYVKSNGKYGFEFEPRGAKKKAKEAEA